MADTLPGGASPMILVVGATGELGHRVVDLLLARGEAVRCLVRPSTDGSRLRTAGADVVAGDLLDPPSLATACDGAETVVDTATMMSRQLAGQRRPAMLEVDLRGTLALIDAAEKAGVRRFVYLSFAGLGGLGLGTALERGKLAGEERLRSTTMRAVIVRPDAFSDLHFSPVARFDLAAGKVATVGRGDTRRRWVTTDDVAALVAALAVEPDPPAVVEFGGPEALSRNEVVALAERLTGRRFRHQHLPRPVARALVRLLRGSRPALASMFGVGLEQDLVPATWDDDPLRRRGIRPMSATDVIRASVGAIDRKEEVT